MDDSFPPEACVSVLYRPVKKIKWYYIYIYIVTISRRRYSVSSVSQVSHVLFRFKLTFKFQIAQVSVKG